MLMASGGRQLGAGFFRPALDFLRAAVRDTPRVAEMPHAVPPVLHAGQAAHVVERHGLPPAHAADALSNLKTDSAVTVGRFGEGAGFSGVYNHESGKFLAFPSGDTLLRSGEVPVNRVERYGGHSDVNHVLSETLDVDRDSNVGFVAVMKGDGSFGFRWTSRSVNQYNPSFEGIQVPEHMRGPIMDAFARTTGRSARSDV
jgi:hypothetical protein